MEVRGEKLGEVASNDFGDLSSSRTDEPGSGSGILDEEPSSFVGCMPRLSDSVSRSNALEPAREVLTERRKSRGRLEHHEWMSVPDLCETGCGLELGSCDHR